MVHIYSPGALKIVASGMELRGYFKVRERAIDPEKAGFLRLAGPDKGHYTSCPAAGRAARFAPFVYRLGRHPFTVERAVRFR